MTIATAQQRVDVLIVGGGLVGATLACALAQTDEHLRIVVCETQDHLPEYSGEHFDPRVVALGAASTEFLASLGVWQKVLQKRACPYRAMSVWDGEGSGHITFDCAESHADQLGYIVESSLLLRCLRSHLAAFDNVRWHCPASVKHWQRAQNGSNRVEFTDGGTLTCDLLVAADGANSALREEAGIRSTRHDYGQTAIITTVRCEKPHGGVARQRFSHTGPLAFLPLPAPHHAETQADKIDTVRGNSHFCSIVWSQDTAVSDRLMALDDRAFSIELGRTFEHRLGEVEWVDQRHAIALHQVHAKQYGLPGFALLGDAAHRIHPLAGQGANLGFYDAAVLANEVSRAVRRGVPLYDESLVQRYQRQRRPHNTLATLSMEGFKRLFAADSPQWVLSRNWGMSLLDRQMPIKRWLADAAAGRFTR